LICIDGKDMERGVLWTLLGGGFSWYSMAFLDCIAGRHGDRRKTELDKATWVYRRIIDMIPPSPPIIHSSPNHVYALFPSPKRKHTVFLYRFLNRNLSSSSSLSPLTSFVKFICLAFFTGAGLVNTFSAVRLLLPAGKFCDLLVLSANF
jgi:hypothetical protein